MCVVGQPLSCSTTLAGVRQDWWVVDSSKPVILWADSLSIEAKFIDKSSKQRLCYMSSWMIWFTGFRWPWLRALLSRIYERRGCICMALLLFLRSILITYFDDSQQNATDNDWIVTEYLPCAPCMIVTEYLPDPSFTIWRWVLFLSDDVYTSLCWSAPRLLATPHRSANNKSSKQESLSW